MKDNDLRNLSPISDDMGVWTEGFSWQACECCGDSLGGDRIEADGYSEKYGVMVFDSPGVCPDCIYYAEYGQLDDMTMQNMEV